MVIVKTGVFKTLKTPCTIYGKNPVLALSKASAVSHKFVNRADDE
jgi:hypothetical protein